MAEHKQLPLLAQVLTIFTKRPQKLNLERFTSLRVINEIRRRRLVEGSSSLSSRSIDRVAPLSPERRCQLQLQLRTNNNRVYGCTAARGQLGKFARAR